MPGISVEVTGQKAIIRELKKYRRSQAKKVEAGLKLGGLYIQRQSQLIVPIDTGALKNSAFTRSRGSGLDTKVGVGYTQEYAIYVHEDLTARHAPGKTAKFLEIPVRRYQRQILAIVKKAAAV